MSAGGSDPEAPLKGGRVTAGVVRRGTTVHRPPGPRGRLARDLLEFLERRGFDGTPRFHGLDADGRQVLEFLPGDVPADLGPKTDEQLIAAARLLRRFHDATVDFPAVRTACAEVMCHNDWAPTNAVFRDGLPCGMIDFDTVAPGLRLWDLGYVAFTWLDLGNTDYDGAEQIRRLDVIVGAYGHARCTSAQAAAVAVARQTALAVSGRTRGDERLATWAESAAQWTVRNVTERLLPTGYYL